MVVSLTFNYEIVFLCLSAKLSGQAGRRQASLIGGVRYPENEALIHIFFIVSAIGLVARLV
ncbi:hypothetical protein C3432_00635 [Citrobacter amalonaticus]|uniref:Uncharacterized protein n=1 Tax=Citrobacter amalonaticus TaxID=35703 RepID=A0A2S4S1W1_CITAM|nr:hypothetical protein [Citrobacter amalonaticus]POT59272.1 hypothetical protein C3432_00635 [Citrobacter amalonaticus]POT77402.1 hypothetical protein C3436_08305 [Citrobacter amalonaticus]POU67854.1 hypothetical protein C3430_01840 [Citrobacter amalonaticus]POV07458.1 hypothetical protein C3424_01850 [Citrobacter amalonaticus]